MQSEAVLISAPAVSRSGGIDLLRVIGVLAVIAGHTAKHATLLLTFPWHVPVFFFLAGYLWKDGRTFSQEWRNRWRTLGYPYLLWFVALFAVYTTAAAVSGTVSLRTELGFVYGGISAWRPFTTFWFLTALLFAALLYRLMSALPLWLRAVIATATAVAGMLAGGVLSRTPLSIGIACACILFLVAGQVARVLRTRLRHEVVIAVIVLAASAALIATGVSAPLDLKSGIFGTPALSAVVAIAISFGLLVLCEHVAQRLPVGFSRCATALAVPATVVVLVHPILLWMIDPLHISHALEFLVTVAVSWGIGLAVVRSRWSPWLAGVPVPAAPRRPTPSAVTQTWSPEPTA